MRKMTRKLLFAAALAAAALPAAASAQEADLAKQLSNPLAALISVPFQVNYNRGIGPAGDGEQFTTNIQPVIPITLDQDWNLISRTIVPIIGQDDIFPGGGDQFGLGNTTQSLFFSPSHTVNGITWGVGPVLYLPTNTDELLGPDTWAAGPTAVALWQGSGWTVGVLGNHLWSFAGDTEISSTYLQPFLSYTTSESWTFGVNLESTYNWETKDWSVPVNVTVAKLVRIGRQPVSLTAGARYWLDSPDGAGPEGWGGRLGMTFLFPK